MKKSKQFNQLVFHIMVFVLLNKRDQIKFDVRKFQNQAKLSWKKFIPLFTEVKIKKKNIRKIIEIEGIRFTYVYIKTYRQKKKLYNRKRSRKII